MVWVMGGGGSGGSATDGTHATQGTYGSEERIVVVLDGMTFWLRPAGIVGRASFWGQLNDQNPPNFRGRGRRRLAKLTALLGRGRKGRRQKGVGRIHRRRWQIGRGDRVPN
jgi:hypothetical protein